MKKTFLVKPNALLSSAGVSWGALALAGAVIVLLVRLVAPNFFWYTFAPVFRAADALAAESRALVATLGNTAVLALQNEQLVNENAALANENKMLLQKATNVASLLGSPSAGRSAAESLHSSASVVGRSNTSGILAGVIARPPESPYDTLVLAEGEKTGITLGMEAFGAGGVPLGVVSAVSADFSRVTLFSTPGMTVNGWVGRANLPLIIKGAGAGAMDASVPRSAGISAGDIVFAPGPGMLPIGIVARIDNDPSSPSAVLRIMLTLNLFSVAWVVVRDTGISLP